MARESVESKALRYIGEGRVVILGKRRNAVYAEVQGSAGMPYGKWRCSCPSLFRCCHVEAVRTVCPDRSFDGPEGAA